MTILQTSIVIFPGPGKMPARVAADSEYIGEFTVTILTLPSLKPVSLLNLVPTTDEN
jgi:hypothetical protein